MRLCKFCNVEKDISSFPVSQGKLRGRCRSCYQEYDRNRRRKQKERDPEAFKAMVQAQLNKRREKNRLYSAEYRRKNPEKYGEQSRRRRARVKNNGFDYYTEKELLAQYGTKCHICDIEIDLTAPRLVGKPGWEQALHVDHLISINSGGPDTLENVRPSHAKCNLSRPRV